MKSEVSCQPALETPAKRVRRRGVRSRASQPVSAFIRRKIPSYELLGDEGLDCLEQQADWILKEIGVEIVGDDESLALFKAAGASVEGTRVRFDPGLAKALCATAPKRYSMYSRNPARTIDIGADSLVFLPAYGSPFVRDYRAGRRYATLQDFENFVKLAYLSPYIHHSGGTVCEPTDLPVNKRHLDMLYSHIKYSDKPFMGAVTSAERAQDSIDMARILYGEQFMQQHLVIQGNINVNSPLVFDQVMTGASKAYARANQGQVISPFILGGAMGPVTQAALVAQAHAETMVGIALTQLVRPGAPVVYGNFIGTLNLKTGAPTFGTPEANLASQALAQLCRRLGLPLRNAGHLTAAKIVDAQAMQESVATMLPGLMAGGNFVIHAAGWLEGGLTMSYEKFVTDLDHCGMLQRMMAGLSLEPSQLAQQAYLEAGPGGNYLGSAHTMAHFETANYQSTLADCQSFEQGADDGARDTEQRAYQVWQQMLQSYQPPELDPAIDEALKEFIAKKKMAMPDRWY